jgi:hypothetical protein
MVSLWRSLEGGSVIHSQVPSRLTQRLRIDYIWFSRFQIQISAASDILPVLSLGIEL